MVSLAETLASPPLPMSRWQLLRTAEMDDWCHIGRRPRGSGDPVAFAILRGNLKTLDSRLRGNDDVALARE
jgi:hypothetical protein